MSDALTMALSIVARRIRPQVSTGLGAKIVSGEADVMAWPRAASAGERVRDRHQRERDRQVLARARELRAAQRELRAAQRQRDRPRRESEAALRRATRALVRLDFAMAGGGTMGELVPRPRDLTDPQTYLEGQLLDSLVGNLSIAEIDRLDSRSLAHLQEKVRAAGFRPSVRAKERERLRTPERHRGSAPSPVFERKSSRHRGRKEQVALMSGKRTARKQPKRWHREAV